ncbi:hypothetical protein EYC80_002478 [Monilinia laxa]|uniref:Uncharacterized protein n=1 Tax=Monilinia laxa TaxID=61186 RepID=A0A5N6K418_MONLA|nr:hypothetical protein EYC80_002478 [Monilinia laxa]
MADQTSTQQQREIPMANTGRRRAVLPILAFEQGYGWRFTGFRIPLVLNPVRAPLPLPAPPILPIPPILANIGIRRDPRIFRRRRRRPVRRRLRRLLPRPLAPWVSL